MTENQKNGICPLMSKVVIKPGLASGVINMPQGQAASVIETGILSVPCAGPNCQLWDGYNKSCSLKSFAGVQYAIEKAVERPRADEVNGSPTYQIVEAVKNIGNTLAELTRIMAIPKSGKIKNLKKEASSEI